MTSSWVRINLMNEWINKLRTEHKWSPYCRRHFEFIFNEKLWIVNIFHENVIVKADMWWLMQLVVWHRRWQTTISLSSIPDAVLVTIIVRSLACVLGWVGGCRSLAQSIRTRPTHHGISGGSFLALERVITLVTVGTGCVLTGLLLLVNWGDPGWWRHGIVCSLPHSSPFSKKHPTQRDQQFQNFPAHFLPPPTKIASDHTKLAYSPVREPLYK